MAVFHAIFKAIQWFNNSFAIDEYFFQKSGLYFISTKYDFKN